MSNREDQQRTAIIAALSGVNERANKVDLQSQELVLVEGTYPALSGQQAKLPGKALLVKFDESVYGIHQFWTPYGYGNNVYQFDGNIGIDPWITPPGGPIRIPNLPPSPYDDTGIILDEFGNNPSYPTPVTVLGTGLDVHYVGDSTNGTVSTPGNPKPDPLPPPVDYILRTRVFYVNFALGAALRSLQDVLHIALSIEEPTVLFSAAGLSAGIYTYSHESGLYSDVIYEALPVDPPAENWYDVLVGTDPATQGGFIVYTHYLATNTGVVHTVTNSWSG